MTITGVDQTPGVGRVTRAFESTLEAGRKALCPFVCAGYPSPGVLARTLPMLESAGATMVEVGVPFSDPIADGPVIAGAMHESLEQGATPVGTLEEIERARRAGCTIPVVLMASVSLITHSGASSFARRARDAGVDGFILPDCPLEEAADISAPMTDEGLCVSLLVSPTTPASRAADIAGVCSGFVYVLTRTGITGDVARAGADPLETLAGRVDALRESTDLPLACGFGISTADDVRRVVRDADADGAIVGTALVRAMGEAAHRGGDASDAAESLTRELASGCARL
ncbi:MAG: tryptophan synthase subunit alpha [Phycisphaerales bacterium]